MKKSRLSAYDGSTRQNPTTLGRDCAYCLGHFRLRVTDTMTLVENYSLRSTT